jgi:putative nucleotidyltransferase with HDIG domain
MKQSDIYKLHQKYATSQRILEICWTHSLIVKEISLIICKELKNKYPLQINETLIEQGALIHDIGKYSCDKKCYIQHGEKGYEILIKEGFSIPVARFALTHVGVGVDNNIPISLEEEIVCYADNFHSKGHPRFNSFEESIEEMIKINPDFGVILNRFKDKFGIPDVKELKEKYGKWHEEINEWVESVK